MKFYIDGHAGYAMKFSPAADFYVAIALMIIPSVNNMGRYDVVDLRTGMPRRTASGRTSQHIFDCSWSRSKPDLIVIATNNGGSHVIDVNPVRISEAIIGSYYGHTDCAVSVDWNPNNGSFITASLDRTVKLWFVDRRELHQTHAHTAPVNCAIWNPCNPDQHASASDDHKIRIWDARVGEATLAFDADDSRSICTCDWNQHGTVVASGAMGGNCVKVWDLRNTTEPVKVLAGDLEGSVIKVKFSRYHDEQVASSFSNGKVLVWEYEPSEPNVRCKSYSHHYGVVRGLDMSERTDGKLASTGDDGYAHIWLHTMQEPSNSNGVQE